VTVETSTDCVPVGSEIDLKYQQENKINRKYAEESMKKYFHQS
jgi:hypothetical protein